MNFLLATCHLGYRSGYLYCEGVCDCPAELILLLNFLISPSLHWWSPAVINLGWDGSAVHSCSSCDLQVEIKRTTSKKMLHPGKDICRRSSTYTEGLFFNKNLLYMDHWYIFHIYRPSFPLLSSFFFIYRKRSETGCGWADFLAPR